MQVLWTLKKVKPVEIFGAANPPNPGRFRLSHPQANYRSTRGPNHKRCGADPPTARSSGLSIANHLARLAPRVMHGDLLISFLLLRSDHVDARRNRDSRQAATWSKILQQSRTKVVGDSSENCVTSWARGNWGKSIVGAYLPLTTAVNFSATQHSFKVFFACLAGQE